MMENNDCKYVCLACSIFEGVLSEVIPTDGGACEVQILDSMLHVRVDELEEELNARIDEALEANRRVLLLYGDCHPNMSKMISRPGVVRVPGVNCIEMLIGHEDYSRQLAEGAFFLMPGWVDRWQEIFENELGLKHEASREMLTEMINKLVYLDSGEMPLPKDELDKVSKYVGAPWEVQRISCDCFKSSCLNTLVELTASSERV